MNDRPLIVCLGNLAHLVEDFVTLFELEGYEALGSPLGDIAIEWIFRYQPAVVLSSYHLQTLNGRQVLQSMRLNPATADIPFILYTAASGLERTAWFGAVNEFIPLPFDTEDMLGKVARMAQSRHEALPTRSVILLHEPYAVPPAVPVLLERLRERTTAPVLALPSRLDGGGINRDIQEACRTARLLIPLLTPGLVGWPYANHALDYFTWHGKPIRCLNCAQMPVPDELAVAHLYEADELDVLIEDACASLP